MKDAVLLLLCAVALAQGINQDPELRSRPCNCDPSEAQQICQANYDNDDVLIAHEYCDKFYKCANGKPVAFYCPNNLLYDPFTETCEWPYNVECGNRPISEGPGKDEDSDSGSNDVSDIDNDWTCNCNPDEAPSICAAEGSNGILVAHQNCNQFYQCAEGRPVSFSCASTLLYNPFKEECDWPQNVECGDRVIPEPEEDNGSDDEDKENDGTCNCNPEEAPAICAAPGSESVLIAHENCNKYYICNHGIPVAISCFGNLLFNPYTKQCDWPTNVDCGDRLVPETECTGCNDNTSDDTSCDGDDEAPSSENDKAPPPGNNSAPEDSNSSEIPSPGDDVVVSTRPPGTCNCNPEEAPAICAAEDSSGVLVASENCNQFYKCDHGKPIVLTCHGDLLYNPYTEQCDWQENVDCGDRVIPDPDDSVTTPGGTTSGVTNPSETNPAVTTPGSTTPGNNCDPSEAPAICAADDSEGVLVAHENCNQFYKCSGGKPVALTCPPHLLFNPAKDQCDWPYNVDCGDRVIPDPESSDTGSSETRPPGDDIVVATRPPGTCNCNPEEAPSICAAEDASGLLVAHENCNQFYKCDHGKPVVLNCHGDLLYNPYTEQCDWPENVDCGDRVISDPDDTVTTPVVTNPAVTTPAVTTPGVTNPGVTNPTITTSGETNPAVTTPGSSTPGNNCDPSEAPAICAADDSEGVLVAHENCNQFYMCSGGKPVALTCPPHLLFNPAKDQCDWPYNVDCGDRVIPNPESSDTGSSETHPPGDDVVVPTRPPGTCNCNPEEAPSMCAAEDSSGVLVAHENCNQFYKCDHGKPVVLTCHGDLLYNPYTEQCDWPENVDCGDRVIPDQDDSVISPGVTNPAVTSPAVTTPAVPTPESNSDSSEIHPPGDDVVVPTRPPGTCNCNPEEALSICAAEDSSGVLVAHENCNQFYICDHGKPVVLTCHGDLLYNPYTEQCDWPENVDCGDRVISDPDDTVTTPGVTNPAVTTPAVTTPGVTNPGVTDPTITGSGETSPAVTTPGSNTPGNNCDPSEAPAICAADDSEGVLVAHENCNQFYMCSGGKPVALTCPPHLLFNPAKDQCDWPYNVDCGDRVIPDPESSDSGSSETRPPGDDVVDPTRPPGTCNCNPEEAPAICAAEDSSGVLVAHENCNQFYKCDHGKPVVLTCHGDLLYNPYTEQCDWPENVDCGDRVIPDPDDSVTSPGVTNPAVTTPESNSDSSEIHPPGDDVVVPTRPPGTCNCNPEEAPSICAAEGSSGVLVAHENCNQFYICDHGKPVVLTCHGDLLYNPYTEQCDWPENVDCGDRVIPDPDDNVTTPAGTTSGVTNPGETNPAVTTPGSTTPGNNCDPSEAPAICSADDSEGVLVAHENCNQFYVCSGGKPVALTCPPHLLFNPAKDQCDWPYNVDCGDRVIPDPESSDSGSSETRPPGDDVVNPTRPPGTCNCNPEEAPAICAAEDSSGVLVAHENCNQFYKCDHGKPVVLTCHGDLLYNPYTEQCDWPENVDCGDRVIPDPDDIVTSPGVTNPAVTTPAVPTPESNSDSSEIHPPGDDVVVPTRPPGTCNCNPEEAPSICAAEDSSGVLVAHENCNQFYICDHGKPVVLTCHGDLLYNPYTEQCDWPENVDCGDRVIPDPDDSVTTPAGTTSGVTNPGETNPAVTTPGSNTPGNNCDPSEAPAICAADDSEGVLVAHENCNQFYMCSGGKPVALTCPLHLLFNPAKDQCDWPYNVDCGDRVIPDPESSDSGSSETRPPGEDVVDPTRPPGTCNCNPEEAPAICAAEDSSGVLVAHENCNQFYKCDHGKPVVLTCHGDLLYNPYTEQCDWPENVDCGDRVIPDPDDIVTSPGVTNPAVTTPAVPTPESNSDSSEIHPPGDDVVVPTRPPGTCNCNPEEAPSICAAEDSSGVLVAHENCNQFYICDHGKPVVLTCHGDLLYNPYTEQCDWPENVDCGDRVIPDPDDSVTTPAGTTSGVTNPGETNPAVTTPGSNTPGNNCDPSEAPAICAADDSEGVLVAHENCNQFYMCSGGKPVALTCPPHLLFNPAKDQCDWPYNVDCGDRVIPDPESSDSGSSETRPPGEDVVDPTRPPGTCNCNPEEAPAICAAEDSSGVLVAHENCNQFYKCDNGKPVVLTCHDDLLYNPYTEQCDWPENVDCGDRVIPDPDDSGTSPGVTNPTVTTPAVTTPAVTTPAVTTPESNSDSSEIHPPGDDVVVPTRPPGTCNCNPEEAPSICAAEDSSGVLVAHENCNQFYKCDHGKPVVLTCHGDLLYNPYTEQCDWPENVDCGDRVISDPDDIVTTPAGTTLGVTNPGETNPAVTTPESTVPGNNCDPSEAPAICAADDSEGVLVAHENCNQFYVCSGGKPVALTCPPHLLFNPAKDQCDWPYNVDCGDRVIPDPESSDTGSSETRPPGDDVEVPTRPPGTCNCNPEEAPSICAAEDSSGVLVAHDNCNQFYKCDHGKPVVLTCHGDLLYNPYTEQCDWPENVDCGDRVIPDTDDSVTTPGVTNPTITTSGVTNPAVTTPAVTTPAVTTSVVTTPESDSVSSEISPPADDVPPQPPVEDSNETEDCSGNSEENGGTCNCDPDQAPSICAVDNSDGVLIAHENCNQFYKCDNGRPVPFECPSNTLYNPVSQGCDWPFNVDCGDRTIPDPEDNVSESKEVESEEEEIVGPCNCNPEEAPAICAVDGSTGVQIAHQNCNQFYVCDHGTPVAFTCNGFLLYNPYTQNCDWPENVECGDRVIPDPVSDENDSNSNEDNNSNIVNDDPSQAPTICAGYGSEGVLVAHENCDQYYICSGGAPVTRPCSGGLLFNPYNEQCDWPSNVICGDRIVPDNCACNFRNAPALCAEPGSDGKLIAHENCNQFYICSHSVPVAQTCPASLLYNTDSEFCDWPQNVNCGTRLLSHASLNKHWQSRQTLRD